MKKNSLFFVGILIITNVVFAQTNKNIFTYKVGEYEISLLSEGEQKGRSRVLLGTTSDMLKKYLPDGTFSNAVNAFIIRTPDNVILVDAGFGTKILDNMKALKIQPKQVTAILLTHMHGDHIGGLMNKGTRVFPNAELYVSQIEHDYWTDPATDNSQNACAVISGYKEKLKLFAPSELDQELTDLLPGISAITAYGHTPGHTMYLINSNDSKLLIWGDLTHALAIQMPHPEISVTYDVDANKAAVSRQNVLKYITQHNIPVAGMHISYPGFGIVTSSNEGGYVFTPLK